MPLIIPIFIIHQGCPNRCIFCNEKKAVGNHPSKITEKAFQETVYSYLQNSRKRDKPAEIAFYGGNFTGIDRNYQQELLEMAGCFISRGLVNSVRISTRPDYLDEEIIDFLQNYSVKTVEVGVQSLVDEVLRLSWRDHSLSDIRRSVCLMKSRGIKTGMHLMVGLPGDTAEGFSHTIRETIALAPDMVRIHPTIVLKDTGLAGAFYRGEYHPLSMQEAVNACKTALKKFTAAGIPIIRLGLQSTPELQKPGVVIAGPFHPSFGSLVEEEIFKDMAYLILSELETKEKETTFTVSPRDVSFFRGHKNKNIKDIKRHFSLKELSLSTDSDQPRGSLRLAFDGLERRLTRQEFSLLTGE